MGSTNERIFVLILLRNYVLAIKEGIEPLLDEKKLFLLDGNKITPNYFLWSFVENTIFLVASHAIDVL